MAERTIALGFIRYRGADSEKTQLGFAGETVDVHEDDLERFDELNGPFVPTSEPDEADDADADAASGEGSGDAPEPYKGVTVPDLKAEIETRNADREDDAKITVPEPGNRPELVAGLQHPGLPGAGSRLD